jgi:hypothetical protein
MLGDPVGVVASRPPTWWRRRPGWARVAAALSSSTRTSTNAEVRAFYGAIGCRELGLMLMKEL